jgi:hypothetical protein
MRNRVADPAYRAKIAILKAELRRLRARYRDVDPPLPNGTH